MCCICETKVQQNSQNRKLTDKHTSNTSAVSNCICTNPAMRQEDSNLHFHSFLKLRMAEFYESVHTNHIRPVAHKSILIYSSVMSDVPRGKERSKKGRETCPPCRDNERHITKWQGDCGGVTHVVSSMSRSSILLSCSV